jgi:peptidoglycan/LPS O-acetylase OafA/YrhL
MTGVRPEIQALRAIAVAVVVLGHSWPGALPGGFVGVDVFFVISGFLITGHLVRDVHRTGRVSLGAFWARRARRILPAALLVLGAVVLATLAFVPESRWGQFLVEARASALYVENWRLASTATDYFAAAGATQSPVQHYWSLSVEEQFYLLWPLLIGAVALVARSRRRLALVVAVGLVAVAGLAYSAAETAADPTAAYFVTPTRVWELAAGGLLALAPTIAGAPRLRALLSWAGLGAIAAAVLLYDAGTAFPGVAALLPVLGAVAVIAAGTPGPRWAPTRLLAAAPVQAVGDRSYALYLWHWPMLVLLPYALERDELGPAAKVAVLAAALLAAWATKRWVEDPIRSGRILTARPAGWTFGTAAVATVLLLAVVGVGLDRKAAAVRADAQAVRREVAAHPRCFGAAARDPRRGPCRNPALREVVVPSPALARETRRTCHAVERTEVGVVCAFGIRHSRPQATAVLVGDSHAMHLQQAVEVVAARHRWHALLQARQDCAFSLAVAQLDEPDRTRCARRNREVVAWFGRHPKARVVIAAALTSATRDVPTRPGQSQFEARVAGFARAWSALPATVERILVVRDTPRVRAETLDCVETAMDRDRPAGPACAVPRSEALHADPEATAARRSKDPRVRLVDVNDALCDARRCYPVVGGVLAYKDPGHLTPLFSQTLGPILDDVVSPLVAGLRPVR